MTQKARAGMKSAESNCSIGTQYRQSESGSCVEVVLERRDNRGRMLDDKKARCER